MVENNLKQELKSDEGVNKHSGLLENPCGKMMNLTTASYYCGLSVRILRKLINKGRVRAYKPGRDFYITDTDLDSFIMGCAMYPSIVKIPRKSKNKQ